MNKKLYIVLLLFIALFKTSGDLHAQKFTEYEVKMVYLYQFAKFVEWPTNVIDTQSEFVIGVYGNNPLGNLPNVIYKDKLFKGKSCKVITVKSVQDAKKCQMIFFSGIKKYDALKFIKQINKAPILLVGDQLEGFCEIGGMINFAHKDADYRFEINPDVAKMANVQISSKLFAVGKVVGNEEDSF